MEEEMESVVQTFDFVWPEEHHHHHNHHKDHHHEDD
jgi:nickel/cobalt exporter